MNSTGGERSDVTLDNFVELATRTSATGTLRGIDEVADRLNDTKVIRLLHAGMGIVTEAGEFLDQLKKHIFYGKPLDEINLMEEMGDIDWYKAEACEALEIAMQVIMQRVIDKLRIRYPEKFTSTEAIDRDLDAEREALEG